MIYEMEVLGKKATLILVPVSEPKPEPAPTALTVTDWEPTHDSWNEYSVCHCGKVAGRFMYLEVCPDCGHKDKWELKVARNEWERSDELYKFGLKLSFDSRDYAEPISRRNYHLVYWTEDHCMVKEG